VFERATPCELARVEPEGALHDLEWVDTLALEARSEGNADVVCGNESISLQIVAPARLEITLADSGELTATPVNDIIKVRARLYDHAGRELEVGKFTTFDWTASDIFQVANDRSSGEFGFCDTCFGMHRFRATKPGSGWVSARLGPLEGSLTVEAIT